MNRRFEILYDGTIINPKTPGATKRIIFKDDTHEGWWVYPLEPMGEETAKEVCDSLNRIANQ